MVLYTTSSYLPSKAVERSQKGDNVRGCHATSSTIDGDQRSDILFHLDSKSRDADFSILVDQRFDIERESSGHITSGLDD